MRQMQPAAMPLDMVMRTDRLNAVAVSGRQLEAALEILAALPAHLRVWPAARVLALQYYAREAGFEENAPRPRFTLASLRWRNGPLRMIANPVRRPVGAGSRRTHLAWRNGSRDRVRAGRVPGPDLLHRLCDASQANARSYRTPLKLPRFLPDRELAIFRAEPIRAWILNSRGARFIRFERHRRLWRPLLVNFLRLLRSTPGQATSGSRYRLL